MRILKDPEDDLSLNNQDRAMGLPHRLFLILISLSSSSSPFYLPTLPSFLGSGTTENNEDVGNGSDGTLVLVTIGTNM